MEFSIDLIKAYSKGDVRNGIFTTLEKYRSLLPDSRSAKILLKPNLNANMNALTGNTTDLRLIAVTVEALKERGYQHITIGEGTNSGYYRNNISVISRLKVDKLAEYYGVKVVDFNYSEPVFIDFEDGIKAGVAKEVYESEFLINMPKFKTHFEVGMSVCLKNLMGCLVGQENKKKTHESLAKNILNINKAIKPHLHIVDGLIAMEGLGPTRGTPIKTGILLTGTDPCLIDLVCAKIAKFDYRQVRTLKAAEDNGMLSTRHHEFVKNLNLSEISKKFAEPKASLFVNFIHSPKRQKYFLAVRNTAFFNWLCSTRLFGYLLFKSGLRQDNFIQKEMEFESLRLNKDRCIEGCQRCSDYCPIGLDLPGEFESSNNGCIECLYCFFVCPRRAIEFKGKPGFMAEQLKQYDDIVRKIT